MKALKRTARRHYAPWLILLAGVGLAVFPMFDARPGLQAWSCVVAGGLFFLSALAVLVVNPTWGLSIEGDVVRWWHDGRGVQRTVSVTELRAVRIDRQADVAELEVTSGVHHVVPRECLDGHAQDWAYQLHQQFPHIELHVR